MKQTANQVPAAQKRPSKGSPVVYILIVLVLLLFSAAMYAVGLFYYQDRFPNRTFVNGIDVSGCKQDRAEMILNTQLQQYTLTLEERGGTETITARQVDLTYQDNGELAILLHDFDPRLWFIDYFRKNELTAETSSIYDQELAEQVIQRLNCFNPSRIIPMENAHLEPAPGGGFRVKEAVAGTQLMEEETKAAILDALHRNDTRLDLDALGLYVAPTVFADDPSLTSQLDDLNRWTSARITYDFEDDRLVIVDQSVIETWLTPDEQGVYSINGDLVFEWVKKNLAYKYDTFGLTHVVNTFHGNAVTLKGGDYGWCIARQPTADALMEAVEKGETVTLEPAYLYRANNRGIDDIGGTYVEISIQEQRMWCYQDYELVVDTPVVTGNVTAGNGTPSGSVWAMDCHKSPAVLGTLDTMGYSSPVNFWMSFTGNVGIHDSEWRTRDPDNYGGEIYLTNGSHGCINTPYDAAKKIFEVCRVGTAVVVY